MFIGEELKNERIKEYKDKMTAASFSAWQQIIYSTGEKITWERYAEDMGIKKKDKTSKEILKLEAKKGYEAANKAIEAFKKYGKKSV